MLGLFGAAPRYRVTINARARRLRLRVQGGEVMVTAPPGCPAAMIERFVSEHRAWIERRQAHYADLTRHHPTDGLRHGACLPVRHGAVALNLIASEGKRLRIVDAGKRLDVLVPCGFDVSGEQNALRAALRRHLRASALAESRRLAHAFAAHGLVPNEIRTSDARTLWGSCSSTGSVKVNWRLIFAPEAVHAYVVAHELAHLRVRDHSARYWAVVEQLDPAWRRKRDWLKRHGEAIIHGTRVWI